MRTTRMNRLGLGGAILLAALALGATPAQATAPTNGTASLGSVAFTKGNQSQVSVPSLAPCSLQGPATASSGPVVKSGVTLGGGTTTCTTTTANGAKTTQSVATGKDFALTALAGTTLRIKTYGATCTGSSTGTSAGWTFGGMSGLTGLPAQIPSGYVHQVKQGSTVLAEITFGEYILPNPADGSIALNTLHIRFKPASHITGDIVLGATACTPVG
ncbi:MAG: hypothetical protein JWQ81_6756 [Amycolatopsis sp.]|jgi:hypothetical protein|uniref:hypothetical protein n=1 Tax=Amycolatopsis sp. TaxID=37632 RepID=UPI0026121DF8|nr:hypothetical protein [Amycolatopsis sp.]MCU1686017.1 hypothetical protein [Amycolatopsis sp.]